MSAFRSVSSIAAHDHACLLYASDAERWDVAAAYVDAGLRAGERIIYVADGEDPESVVAALTAAGANCARHRSAGQLQISYAMSLDEPDSFDPERLTRLWQRLAHGALADGFRGLRAVVDSSWTLRNGLGIDAVVAYERTVQSLFATHPVSAICLYDERLWAGEAILAAAEAHPAILCGGWHHHLPSRATDELALAFTESRCLRVAGTVDLGTVARFADALRLASRADGDLTLDLAELRFFDVRALGSLLTAARELVRRGHALRVRNAPADVRRLLALVREPVVVV
jgi:anti-anti-sigma regulatory factor